MKKIALFASGSGSNVENIIHYFRTKNVSVAFKIYGNNPHAFVFERAKKLAVDTYTFTKSELQASFVLDSLQAFQPDWIVLAGFLLKFPEHIIHAYPNKVINIHPALLPKYGGKGMYGMHVHQAVLDNKEKATGITIHYVNEHYDEGGIIFQQSVNIEDCKTADEIADKIHVLEHHYFPEIIEQLLTRNT
ncbi:phosphoribosylglycinamide formyltransferase [Flavobacterium aciduliphilum]|uniref:Phosphoribosylglycinamide formyltransferase n=1 Tax=Flavobacterium aciduliphilum TaxID=1101402 RepID=A0A328YHA7_9FLAO|nr:phosphoribosylglycinamide formyltransferase [Flavobacterium aciduliphilum]RAR71372.1 formyltetrahydrofolate-dependent phosphoribosylglycinamide formyltransferase [Flavobacterium aciduliphilum]